MESISTGFKITRVKGKIMIKRFIDADLFTKKFFRSLAAEEKVLFFYITTTCTYDGFWEHDPE